MLLLRIGRTGRWAGPDSSVETAMKDLGLRPDEAGLSVFRVENRNSAVKVAQIYAPTAWKKPEKIDFILFDEDLVCSIEGLETRKTASGLHPELSDVHHEILGLDADKTRRLAEAIRKSSYCVERISKSDLIESVRRRLRGDAVFKEYIYPDWLLSATQ